MLKLDPWRIEPESFEFRLTKGWLNTIFENWIEKTSQDCGLQKDVLFLSILETMRKISQRVIEVLEWQTKFRNAVAIPPFIISYNLSGYPSVISRRMSEGFDESVICDKESLLDTYGLFGRLHITSLGLSESVRVLAEGRYIWGITSSWLIAYNQIMTQEAFESILVKNHRLKNIFLENSWEEHIDKIIYTICEETMHYFDYQTNPGLMKRLSDLVVEKSHGSEDVAVILEADQEAEQELGLKDRALQIFNIIKNQSDLFSPLEERLDLYKINTP